MSILQNLKSQNLNITKFLVHKVGGAKWPDSRWVSAAYQLLMTTLPYHKLDVADCECNVMQICN